MNFKKIKRQIIDGIGEKMITEGFLFNKKDEFFEKNIRGGIVTFYFLHADYGTEFWFDLWWGVRIDRMAEIFNQVEERDPEYHHLTTVLSNHLGALIDYTDKGNEMTRADRKRYIVRKEADAETVIDETLKDIRRYLLPYVEKNSSCIEGIDQLLNRHPRERSIHNYIYPHKAMMGLIAAKLTKNPNYAQLISICDEEFAVVSEEAKREYEKLKVLLAKM